MATRAYKRSFAKTSISAAGSGLFVIVATHLIVPGGFPAVTALVEAVGWVIGALFETVALGGVIALYRDHGERKGRADLFLSANEAHSEQALTMERPAFGIRVRRGLRGLAKGRWALIGDRVEVRSLEEIQNTLDANGCLDGLPFIPEMVKFCGQRASVFRCVDKIYDYGRSKTLRRIRNVVLLRGLRCDGRAHGGCQALCYLMWKTAWLKDAEDDASSRSDHLRPVSAVPWAKPEPEGMEKPPRYTCQYTQLAAASTPMSGWDVRQDLRPLLAGNVTVRAFCVAVLTRLFNEVQEARHGTGYPAPWRGPLERTPRVALNVVPGDRVQVLRKDEIAVTLDGRGRNHGLWFDDDMIKRCGHSYRVLKRVERIIDDATGQMLEMKAPCIVLDEADASGEFLRLCPQHEYPFWREVWLSPETRPVADTARVDPPVNAAGTLEARRSG
jgi:hypothetical protein